jgi:hypothetical protein
MTTLAEHPTVKRFREKRLISLLPTPPRYQKRAHGELPVHRLELCSMVCRYDRIFSRKIERCPRGYSENSPATM